jgi:hypothetical protein
MARFPQPTVAGEMGQQVRHTNLCAIFVRQPRQAIAPGPATPPTGQPDRHEGKRG